MPVGTEDKVACETNDGRGISMIDETLDEPNKAIPNSDTSLENTDQTTLSQWEIAEQIVVLTKEFFGIKEQVLRAAIGPLFKVMQEHSISDFSIERRGREAVLSCDGKRIVMVPKKERR